MTSLNDVTLYDFVNCNLREGGAEEGPSVFENMVDYFNVTSIHSFIFANMD